jgi:trypsin
MKKIFVALLFASIATMADAQPRTPGKNEGDASFKAVKDLNQETNAPKLGNAEPADPLQWQASFYSWSGNVACTSTLIGARVLLTAAHCVGDGKRASIRLEDKEYSGPCTHHPHYATDASADYALCHLEDAVGGVPYEMINTKAEDLKKGMRLRLSGYGCVTLTGFGPNDGIYRIGEAPITGLPGEIDGEANTITTVSLMFEDALLCKGDSGGPAFIESEISSARKVVSVNSRVWPEMRRSYLSSLTSPAASNWIAKWIGAGPDRHVCGFSPEAQGCR